MPGPPHPPDWRATRLGLSSDAVAAMREELPQMAEQTVSAIQHEVEEYADPFRGEMGRAIKSAVALALGGFLTLVSGDARDSEGMDERVWDAAYALGRGEARSGRSMDALLRAYRVGARVSWRDMSATGVRVGLDAGTVATFAELVFTYIDELSAMSAAGHADELAATGRAQQRLLEQLADALVAGRPPASVESLADRAGWKLPEGVTAVLVPERDSDRARGVVPAGTLQTTGSAQQRQLDGLPPVETLLVPGGASARRAVLSGLTGDAVVGPVVDWHDAASSAERAARVLRLREHGRIAPERSDGWGRLDCDDHLVALALTADEEVVDDLRAQVLQPMAQLRPSAADKLTETLRAWLLHQGRREDMARMLFVHPQTVRYRMGQLRDLYGERLEDPDWVLRCTVAVGLVTPPTVRT
jgi:hypothetical protein